MHACPPFSLLPINENADTVAINAFLLGRHIEHVVVGEALVLAHDHLGVVHGGTHLTHVDPLLGQLGAHSEIHNTYDILCFRCYNILPGNLIIIQVYMCVLFSNKVKREHLFTCNINEFIYKTYV